MIKLQITIDEQYDGDVNANIGIDQSYGTEAENQICRYISAFIHDLGLRTVKTVQLGNSDFPEIFTGDGDDVCCDGYCPACDNADSCEEEEDTIDLIMSLLESAGINTDDCNISVIKIEDED